MLKEKINSLKAYLQNIWKYNVIHDNWLIRVIMTFLFIFVPLFIGMKISLILGINSDPNIGDVKFLDLDTVANHFQQYVNWGTLQTKSINNGNIPEFMYSFPITDVWFFLFIIVTLYAIYDTYKSKDLSYFFLPLLSFITIFFIQLILLERLFQRYVINFYVFIFLLTIVLTIKLFIKGSSYFFLLINKYSKINTSNNVKSSLSLVMSIVLLIIIFLPVVSTHYPQLQTESRHFEKPGIKDGIHYIYEHFSDSNTLLGIDDGWRADWFFFNYERINVIYLDGWSQFYNKCLTSTNYQQIILFMDSYQYHLVILQNTSFFDTVVLLGEMGIYQFNSSKVT
jgi:hypothetical protein